MSSKATRTEVIKSLISRFISLGLGFSTVAILIRALGVTGYGTWATLISLLAWVQLSDFGVGHVLKNRIASAPNPSNVFKLVCGVFQLYTLIGAFIALLLYLLGDFLIIVNEYKTEAYIVYFSTIIFFPLTISTSILQGCRKNSICLLFGAGQALLWLIFISVLFYLKISLLILSIGYISILLFVSTVQFWVALRILVGTKLNIFRYIIDLSYLKLAYPLFGVGIKFIALQLSSIILFSMGTYLTYSNLSPEAAAEYDVLFKCYQIPLTLFNVVISIYWVEIARLISENNRVVLQKKYKELQFIVLIVSITLLGLSILFAPWFVNLYSSGKIAIKLTTALIFWLLTTIQISSYAGAVFLNAAEKLKGQIILSTLATILLIPLVLFFYSRDVGFSSVPLASALLITPNLIYCNWTAYHHVIKKTI